MTSPAQGSAGQTEGTSLPPPRPFADPNTLTLPRRRRHLPQGVVVGLVAGPAPDGAVLRAEIMRVEAVPFTVTF